MNGHSRPKVTIDANVWHKAFPRYLILKLQDDSRSFSYANRPVPKTLLAADGHIGIAVGSTTDPLLLQTHSFRGGSLVGGSGRGKLRGGARSGCGVSGAITMFFQSFFLICATSSSISAM